MLKKIRTVLLGVLSCAVLAGCSAGGKEYAAIEKCQKAVLELESARLIVTSTTVKTKTETTVTEFAYKLTAAGNYEYCQTQFDSGNKAVYCEYSDGEKAEQWLIGSGWCVIDPTVYTKKNPHRYIQLLSSVCDSKAVESITVAAQGGGFCYTVILKPEVLNETVYEEEDPVEEETVTITTDSEDNLIYYADAATFLDRTTQEPRSYTLEMQLSDPNSVAEITKPDLRDYSTGS